MRHLVFVFFLVFGIESTGQAFDIPVPSNMNEPQIAIKTSNGTSNMSQVGTIIGGAMLATAVLLGGLWVIGKRKMNPTN